MILTFSWNLQILGIKLKKKKEKNPKFKYSSEIIIIRVIRATVVEQVGGWTEVYDGLTFATVRGAGHEVPLFQPHRAFVLFKSFLAGKELPKS